MARNFARPEDAAVLDDLVQTIEMLRARVSKYAPDLSKNEIRTRAVLIDPMLKVLGWDAADPALVTVEYEVPPGRADYGLRRGLDNPPVILVEAKRLNEPLDTHVGQLLNYALVRGVRYGCLTDGNIWEVYDVFKQVPLEERKILSLAISDGEPAKVALAMLGLWRRSLQDGSFEQAAEPLVDVERPPAPPPVVPPPPPLEWTPLVVNFESTGKPAPTAIKLPDGEERPTAYWVSVLKETALWLHRTRVLTQGNCKIKTGPKRYLLSLDGKHQGGERFKSPIPLEDTGITLEGHFSARDIVRHTKDLMEHFGKDPSQVYLKFE